MYGSFELIDDVMKIRSAFDGFFRDASYRPYEYPLVNLSEDGDALELRALLPGVKVEDLSIELVDSSLVIQGMRKSDAEDVPYIRRERVFGEFKKSVKLPFAVNRESVSARMENGILTVSMVKSEEAKPKK